MQMTWLQKKSNRCQKASKEYNYLVVNKGQFYFLSLAIMTTNREKKKRELKFNAIK